MPTNTHFLGERKAIRQVSYTPETHTLSIVVLIPVSKDPNIGPIYQPLSVELPITESDRESLLEILNGRPSNVSNETPA